MEVASQYGTTTSCSSLGEGHSFFLVDDKENALAVSSPQSEMRSNMSCSMSCSGRSSAGRSFILINSQACTEELSDEMVDENRRVVDLLRSCPREMAPSERVQLVEHLITVLCKTNRALGDLQKLASVYLLSRKDYCWGNLKLEQNERNLHALRKNNKHLLNVWRKNLAATNATGQSAIRLAALVSVFSQNITLIQQTRQNITKCAAESDEKQFQNKIAKIVSGANSKDPQYRPIFPTPKDVYMFLKDQLRNCGCDVLRHNPEHIGSTLNLLHEVGEPFSCEGWDLHVVAIRELYEHHGECLPPLETLGEWALLNTTGERPEDSENCTLANGPNSYWDP